VVRKDRRVIETHKGDLAALLVHQDNVISMVKGSDVVSVLQRLPRARRRRLIERTTADAADGAHSLPEIDFLRLCRRNQLPEPSRQVARHDSAGRRRYLDAYFDEWQVHVEIDGGQHLDPRQAWDDMRRQNELWIAGDRVLRFPAWALRADPTRVISQVRAALQAAGWPG
jgi:very-short-patch-repair endonuclease